MQDQPRATDFTEVVPSILKDGKFVLRVILDSGQCLPVAMDLTFEAAERRELVINQAMIEYRTKRNAYERDVADYCKECRVPEHDTCSMTDGCPCCEQTKQQQLSP